MTVRTHSAATPTGTTGPARVTRVLALAGAETRLLVRNRTALANSVVLPLLLVAAVPLLDTGQTGPLGPLVLVAAVGVVLAFLTYYNLVTTYVARREGLVLQRMRTGELSGVEVLVATAAPTVVVTVGQLLLVGAGVAVIGQWVRPVDVVLPLVAVVGGTVMTVILALASTAFTRTAESAQITTLPLMIAATGLSGMLFPLSGLGDQVVAVARLLPFTPVVELLQLGLAGTTVHGTSVDAGQAWAAAVHPLLVLGGWIVLGVLAARRWFRWVPRR